MKALIVFALPVLLSASPGLSAEPESDCGTGVPQSSQKASSIFDPTAIMRDGVFQIEGGLFTPKGVPQCAFVRIVCQVETGECKMAEARLLKEKPYIGPVKLADPMGIITWTTSTLKAEGKTHLCKSTELTVDFVDQKARLLTTPLCPGGGPARLDELRTFSRKGRS